MTKDRLAHIDSLRGVAILMVILVHTSQSVSNQPELAVEIFGFGRMGVQLFFVLSAIILCHTVATSGNRVETGSFYCRRFFRIAPLYYFGIFFYFVLRVSEGYFPSLEYISGPTYTPANILTNVFFVQGLVPNVDNDIIPGGWSIGIEMAFYLVFPAIYSFLGVADNRLLFTRFAGLSLGCVLIVFVLNAFFAVNDYALYHNLINMLPVFLVGILYYRTLHHVASVSSCFLALAFLALLSFSFIQSTYLHHPSATPFISAVAFVFAVELFRRYKRLNFRWLSSIGRLSYSMYVFHFVLAWPVSRLIDTRLSGSVDPMLIFMACFIFGGLISFLVAALSEKYIEQPGMLLGKRLIEQCRRPGFSEKMK